MKKTVFGSIFLEGMIVSMIAVVSLVLIFNGYTAMQLTQKKIRVLAEERLATACGIELLKKDIRHADNHYKDIEIPLPSLCIFHNIRGKKITWKLHNNHVVRMYYETDSNGSPEAVIQTIIRDVRDFYCCVSKNSELEIIDAVSLKIVQKNGAIHTHTVPCMNGYQWL